MLCPLFPCLIHSITGSPYFPFPFTYFSSPSPPSIYKSILCIYRSDSTSYLLMHLFCFLDSTYEWNHMVLVPLSPTHFTQHNTLQVHPCFHKWQDIILFIHSKWSIFEWYRIYLSFSKVITNSFHDTDRSPFCISETIFQSNQKVKRIFNFINNAIDNLFLLQYFMIQNQESYSMGKN